MFPAKTRIAPKIPKNIFKFFFINPKASKVLHKLKRLCGPKVHLGNKNQLINSDFSKTHMANKYLINFYKNLDDYIQF